MKVILIGLGKMGQFHLQNLLKIESIKHIYAFDVFEETFKIQDSRITYSTNLDDFDSVDTDFVDIVAPTQFHFSYLERYIKQNKNIFVEKPFVSTQDEMDKIGNLIQDHGYTGNIGVGFIERFNVVSQFLKQTLQEKRSPQQVEIFRYNPGSDRIGDADVTTDLMIHDLDLINYFFDAKSIELIGKNIQNTTSTVLLKSGNTNITLSANRITQQKIREIKFYYKNITVVADLMLAKIEFYHKPSEYLSPKGQDLSITYMLEEKILMKNNPLLDELREFTNIVAGGEYINLANYTSGKESISILNKLGDNA